MLSSGKKSKFKRLSLGLRMPLHKGIRFPCASLSRCRWSSYSKATVLNVKERSLGVHALDRWSRNTEVLLRTVKTLKENGVELHSITQSLDYSNPQGRLMLQLLGSFAKFSSDMLSEHVDLSKLTVSLRACLPSSACVVSSQYALQSWRTWQ